MLTDLGTAVLTSEPGFRTLPQDLATILGRVLVADVHWVLVLVLCPVAVVQRGVEMPLNVLVGCHSLLQSVFASVKLGPVEEDATGCEIRIIKVLEPTKVALDDESALLEEANLLFKLHELMEEGIGRDTALVVGEGLVDGRELSVATR